MIKIGIGITRLGGGMIVIGLSRGIMIGMRGGTTVMSGREGKVGIGIEKGGKVVTETGTMILVNVRGIEGILTTALVPLHLALLPLLRPL